MRNAWRESCFAWRRLLREPGASLLAVLALALGIGFTGTFFSILDGTLLRGLPVDQPHELVTFGELEQPVGDSESYRIDYGLFEELRRHQSSFDDLAPFYVLYSHATAEGYGTDTWITAFCDSSLFDLVGVEPILGRRLGEIDDDPAAPQAAVVSYHAWKTQFRGDPDILGKTLVVNRLPTIIVGVMPENFGFPLRHDLWVSLRSEAPHLSSGSIGWVFAFGRLADGIRQTDAHQDLERLTQVYDAARGRIQDTPGDRLTVSPFVESLTDPTLRSALEALGLAGLAVLLIAVANVANLLLVRAIGRRREWVMRSVLGAGRWRLVQSLLAESLIIASLGGALGVLLTGMGIDVFNATLAGSHLRGYWVDVRLDGRTLALVMGTVVVAALLASILPALKGLRVASGEILGDTARGHTGFRLDRGTRGLLIAEVALSFSLLVATGLMVQSVHQLGRVEDGIDIENVSTATVSLWQAGYEEESVVHQFFDDLLRDLELVPGIQEVAYASALPYGRSPQRPFQTEGGPQPAVPELENARWARVTSSFFDVFGIEVLAGRVEPKIVDGEVAPGVLVNRSFALQRFGHLDVIGRRLRVRPPADASGGDASVERDYPWVPIHGLVADVSSADLSGRDAAMVYSLSRRDTSIVRSLALRSSLDSATLTRHLREAVSLLDGLGAVYRFETMEETLERRTWNQRVFSMLFSVFGIAALLLAAIGIYAVISFVVERRRREMGIRRALGALGKDLVVSVVRRSMIQVVIGLLLGAALTLVTSRLLSALLFEVEPWDGTSFLLAMFTLTGAGFLASWWPAMRAGRVDPAVVLRDG